VLRFGFNLGVGCHSTPWTILVPGIVAIAALRSTKKQITNHKQIQNHKYEIQYDR
jgi:hypothetical protein